MNYFSIDYIYRDIMPEVQYRKNVTSFAYFNDSNGEWVTAITAIPDFSPDECIIKLITFRGEDALPFGYMIWSNINNDYIASMCGGSNIVFTPNTIIQLTAPISNQLHFKLFSPVDAAQRPGGIDPWLQMTGEIVIHLEFVKYKRTPQRV